MSDGIIEHTPGGDNSFVTIGDNQQISMKLVQSIYNEVTGKTESLSQSFRKNHEVTFDDLKQLDTKINQLYEQYNVVTKNCSVTLFHVNDCKEQFSSFERFEIYDSSNLNPCENIRLQYNFLIVLPSTNKPQPYTLTIDLHSRVGFREKAKAEHGFARRLIRIMASQTGNIEIEYIDYTVARNFMVAIDQWHKSLVENTTSRLIETLQDKSEHFSFLFRLITTIVVSLILYFNALEVLEIDSSNPVMFSVAFICFCVIYIIGHLSFKLGTACERAIDSYQPISALLLNRGDKKARKDFDNENRKSIIKTVVSTGAMILVNVISAYVISVMGIGS